MRPWLAWCKTDSVLGCPGKPRVREWSTRCWEDAIRTRKDIFGPTASADAPSASLIANSRFNFNKSAHDLFRPQGHGTIYFYTNQPSKASETAEA